MNHPSIVRAAMVCALLLSFLYFSCNDEDKSTTGNGKVATAQSKGNAEHGKYLANIAGCLDCHSERQFQFLSGPVRKGTEGMGGELFSYKIFTLPGELYARNITSDTATGIGNWTDAEVIKAITQGISRNGDSLFPLMPYEHFSKLAKEDILDIVAFIRTLPPIAHKVPQRQLMGPISAFYASVPNTIEVNKKPAANNLVEYGKYLVNMASCVVCHTPVSEKGVPGEPFSGGFRFTTPAFTVQSANLTSDSATGLGTWTRDRFVNKFNSYREPSGYLFDPKAQNTYMPWSEFAKMNNDDLSAIFAYLQTLKPVKNLVEKYPVVKK